MSKYIDYDKFVAEREVETKTVRIFGRDCKVPAELPFDYMMLLIRRSAQGGGASMAENVELFQRLFSPEDFEHISTATNLRASDIHSLVRIIWLENHEEESDEPDEVTEDSLAIEKSGANKGKKA